MIEFIDAINQFFEMNPFVFMAIVGVIALMVGSFLNVVIWRLPLMLKAHWCQECCEFLHEEKILKKIPAYETNRLKLYAPRSHCPSCRAPLKFYHNIPILSYLFLKGQCSNCQEMIPLRYPFIEGFTMVLSITVVFYFGPTAKAYMALILTWILITLAWIDIETQLLPDNITLPVLWLGLIANYFGIFVDLPSAVLGAIAGYLFLFLVYWFFKLFTGKEGMGHGDFKITAMLGAWLGWQALPCIVFIASLTGAILGLSLIGLKKIERSEPVPFGPFLALAGWLSLVYYEPLQAILGWIVYGYS